MITEGSSSPFLISSGGGCSSSSISILSSQYERLNERVMSLPPLTSLVMASQLRSFTRDLSMDSFGAVTNVVHGSGLHLNDILLHLGTGPLFDFGVLSSLSAAIPSITISLTHSSLRNVSSLAPESTQRLFPQARQILVSCGVEESTNHFSGTATADVNMCGSFLARNSSFAKCSSNLVASDEHPFYTLAHRTGTNLITVPTDTQIDDVKITRCTFKDMKGSSGGTAIYFSSTIGHTTFHECSFYNCNGTSNKAATVYLSPSSNTHSVTLSSCVVVRCASASIFGGAIVIMNAKPFIASDCVFYQTETKNYGSSLTIINSPKGVVSSVSNSVFESASATSSLNGSALCFRTSYESFITSLRFVDTQRDGARDVLFDGMNYAPCEDNMTFCQSSRSSFICESSKSSVITSFDKKFTTITKETFVKSFSGSENQNGKATFQIELENAVTGQMVIVLENLDSARSSTTPPVTRSLTFSFTSPAKTASCTVVVGDSELIQSPAAEYKLVRAAIPNWLVHTMRVKSNTISFNDDLETLIDISLDCDGLVKPGYSILVKTGKKESVISLNIGNDANTLTATGRAYPITDSVLSYATDYTIVSVKDIWGRAIILPNALNIRTPDEPPRINKMSYSGLDSTGEHLIVRVRGRQMPIGTYTIQLTQGGSFDVVFGAVKGGETLAERYSETVSVPIYGENKKILFNTLYTINSAFEKSTGSSIHVSESETEMVTPVEPARITAITGEDYDPHFTQLTLSFSGINCVGNGNNVTVKNTATQVKYTFNVAFDTPQTGSHTEYMWKLEGTTNLKFGATYEVVGVAASSGKIYYTKGMTFSVVPPRHRLVSTGTLTIDDNFTVATVPLTGEDMPIGNTTLQLVDSTHYAETQQYLYLDVEITFSTKKEGLLTIQLYPTPQLVYGHVYVTWAMNRTGIDETMFVTRYNPILMPTEPSRLERIAKVEYADDEKEIRLNWEGRLMTNGPYTVTLSVNGSSTTTSLTLEFDVDESTSTTTEILYKSPESRLKYNTVYVVTGLTDESDKPVIVNSGITFTTIAEPTRLLKLSGPVDGTDLNTTTLTLTGHHVPAGDATLVVVLSSVVSGSETDSDKIALPVSFTRSGDVSIGAVVIPLYPTSTLSFGKTYRIVSLSSAKYVDTILTFTTPSRPGRIVSVESLTYDDLETEVTITVTGLHCPPSAQIITLKNEGTSAETKLTFKWISAQKFVCTESVWRETGNAELVAGARYTLVQTDASDVFVHSGLEFQLRPAVSRIVSLGDFTNDTDLNSTTIAVVGEKMSTGTYSLNLLDSTHFEYTGKEEFVETQIVFTSATEGSMTVDLYPAPQLIFGHTYSIESFTKPETVTEKVINHVKTLSMPTEPSRLERITKVVYVDDEKEIRLFWEGRVMTNGPYTVTLSVNGSSTATTTLTLEIDSERSTSTTTETLFNATEALLRYNTAYVVTGVSDALTQPVLYNSGLSFTTNPEPTRLLKLSGPVDTLGMNSTVLTLTGHQVPAGDATLVVVLSSVVSGSETDSDKIALPVSFTRSGDVSTGTVSISLYPTSTLAFDQTYRIVSLSSAKYIDVPLTFKTPVAPPRITKLKELTYNEMFTEVTVHFEGIDFSTNLVCTLTFKEVNTEHTNTLEVTFKPDQKGAGKLEMWNADGTSKVKQGKTYEIVGATSVADASLVFNSGMQFKVTDPLARIVSVGTAINGGDLNTTKLAFVGENMPSGSYSVSLTDSTILSETCETVIVDAEIVFESKTTGSMTVDLYPAPQLIYGHTYTLTSFTKPETMKETVINHLSAEIPIPSEPCRLEGVTPILSDDAKQVTLTFVGRVFASGMFSLTLQPTSSSTEIVIPLIRSEDGTLSCSISAEESSTPHVVLGQAYTIAQITKDSSPIIINPKAKQFTAPVAALFKSISFEFTNSPCTSYKLVLTGENVSIHQNYVLTLASGETFAVTFSTPECGETKSHAIGWSDTLQYGTEYTVASLKEESSESPMRKQAHKFTTMPKPLNFTAFVDQTSHSDDVMCGDQVNPCGSIEKAMTIAVGLEHDEVTINVLKETKETKPFVISRDMSVLIKNGKNLNPIIRIPASTTLSDDCGLITVNEGNLELFKVEVAVETISESFVFLLAVNSTIILENCVIDGVNIPVPNSDSFSVCEWTSGIIRLDNCETTIDWTKFHELPQGALTIQGGTITIDSSVFRDNTPNHELFPSARRNILCSGEGEVRIGTLSSGDGTPSAPSAWMALGDCHLNSTSVDGTKLLFIPTLDSTKTKSKSTSKSYEVSLVGSVLMPCGLGLEVVEWDEKAKVEKRSTTIELAGLNSSEWSETSVNLILNRSSITDIDHSLELHAKLSFGQNQRTDNHFVLKISDASEKKALTLEQTKKALVWLIPVIVAVVTFIIIVIIVLICRKQRQQKDDRENLLKNRELDQQEPIDVEKIEEHMAMVDTIKEPRTNNMLNHNLPTTIDSNAFIEKDTMKQVDNQDSERRVPIESKTKMAVRCGEELVEVPVNVNNTLYNRLHKGGPPLDSPRVFRMITQGLAQIAKHNPKMPILTRLSPLWVFLDEQDTPVFQMKEERVSVQPNIPESSFFPGSEHSRMNQNIVPQQEHIHQTLSTANTSFFTQTMNGQSSIQHIEGQRWVAPEVANKKVEIDASKAAVFSLGLILWEMETGLVPFGEVDAVNAQRQLGTGSLPLMDSWTNESKIELVRRCLSLDPKERSTLDEILSLLDSDAELGKPAMERPNMEEC
ncbi:hypothetical protein BLNAU_6718 [Blattamonas nauphoetae]|uniref:Protein kinase domain-containing protein n=1 Tax=Blattamonas nauphoetae TaxID=2049346 RepID=A0ABQ9Y3C6_9EUKA|nr:hypothetical protein BLNAU_6718 [Blattamonas nauphoetae]